MVLIMMKYCLLVCFIITTQARVFEYETYAQIVGRIESLERDFPNLISVFTAQERYGLQSPGQCGSTPCLNHIVHITNKNALTDETPEVLISGELHGNERTGPGIAIELLTLLTNEYGKNKWITHLLDTRSIYVVPMTNAQGYYANTREESRYDPNRDFPNDNPVNGCMNTIAARTLNELSREHAFQISLSYHGGIQLIGYMWGSTSYADQTISPDDIVQRSLGSIMSATAGKYLEGLYPHGRINDELYSVRGAFEVWAYAGSWEPNPDGPCKGNRIYSAGYPEAKTLYDPEMLGQINILIETSRSKIPSESTLGSSDDILRVEGAGDGHFTRNIRIGLSAIDMAEPYVTWTNEQSETETITVKPGAKLPLSYEVGGSVHVTETFTIMGQIPSGADMSKRGFGFSPAQLRSLGLTSSSDYTRTPKQSGLTRWGGGGYFGSSASAGDKNVAITAGETTLTKAANLHSRSINPFIPAWQASVTAPTQTGEYFIMAAAMVDQDWAESTNPDVVTEKPFSHLVNARTNILWDKTVNGHRVIGRKYWYSVPIRVVVSNNAPDVPEEPACKDNSPSNVEYLGRNAACGDLVSFCSQYDFVRSACPVTCNACSSVGSDKSPAGSRPACNDAGGIIDSSGSSVSCFSVRQYCETETFVKERCASTCGYCRSFRSGCVDEVDTGIPFPDNPDGPSRTCEELKDNCNLDSVKRMCPATCNNCASFMSLAGTGFQISPIIPVIGGSSTTPSPTSSTDGGESTLCECRGGSGPYDNCVFYQPLNANVCLIKYTGGSSSPPPCDPPAGGEFRYSSNQRNWYVIGCTSTAANVPRARSDAEPLENQFPVTIVALSAGVVGAFVVVGTVFAKKKNQKSSSTPKANQTTAEKTEDHLDLAAGNPLFGETTV